MAQGTPSGPPTDVARNDRRGDGLGTLSPLINGVGRWPLSTLAAIYITAYSLATLFGSEQDSMGAEWVRSALAFLPLNLLTALTAGLASRRTALHPATRLALRWLSVASACTALGNIAWFIMETRLGRDPTDTFVTLIYLSYYPPVIGAVLAFPVIRLRPTLNPRVLLDSAILLVASVVATWLTFLLMPREAHGAFGTLNTLGFAFGSLVMMFVLARAVLLHRVRDVGPGFPVLVAGLFGQTLLDLVFPQAPIADTLLGQRGENLGYALSYGVMVLGCEMFLRRPTAAESPGLPGAQRDPLLALPYLAAILVLVPQAAVVAQRWSSPLGPLVVASTLIGLLLLARQAVAVRERAALRARLSQAQRLEALGRFAGGIAHDFNNVLSVVYADIELASSVLPPDSPARADLDEALGAATRAATLIRQLLTFSRHQRNRIETVDLDRVMGDAERMLGRC